MNGISFVILIVLYENDNSTDGVNFSPHFVEIVYDVC